MRGHTPEFEAACGSPAGIHAMLQAAKAEAMTGVDLLREPEALRRVKEEFLAMKAKYE